MDKLREEIEKLSIILTNKYCQTGLTDEVVNISQELDLLLNQYLKQNLDDTKNNI